MPDALPHLFPPIQPRNSGMLAVDDIHTIYWEEVGNPNGILVVFFHGGPGAGMSPQHRRFFNPDHYRVILLSTSAAPANRPPLGEVRNNTTQILIEDIERLRTLFGIDKWLVFGGPGVPPWRWRHGQAHPERRLGFNCAASSSAPRRKSTGSRKAPSGSTRRCTTNSSPPSRWKNAATCCKPTSSASWTRTRTCTGPPCAPGAVRRPPRVPVAAAGRTAIGHPGPGRRPHGIALHGQPGLLQRRPAAVERLAHRPPACGDRAGPL